MVMIPNLLTVKTVAVLGDRWCPGVTFIKLFVGVEGVGVGMAPSLPRPVRPDQGCSLLNGNYEVHVVRPAILCLAGGDVVDQRLGNWPVRHPTDNTVLTELAVIFPPDNTARLHLQPRDVDAARVVGGGRQGDARG